MNALGVSILWAALQVSLVALFAGGCYLVARRRGPAVGSLVATSALLVTLSVLALAVSPWPRWWTVGETRVQLSTQPVALDFPLPTPLPAAQAEATASVAADVPPAPAIPGEQTPPDDARIAATFWRTFLAELTAPEPVVSDVSWRWPAAFAAIFFVAVALGLGRLLLGLWSVRMLRAESRPLDNLAFADDAVAMCRQMQCTRHVELRTSPTVTSPVTIGWRRPLVIVPTDWPLWTPTERRVSLAHEIAHVCRGDFLTGVIAQFSVAANFYHPLVHWFSRRLRLEQELAADAAAAAAVGNRQDYLLTLAQVALRCDERRVAWAARPFLPTRGAFLRRIDMLRDPKQLLHAPFSSVGQIGIVAVLFVAGFVAAGIRAPQRVVAAAQDASATVAEETAQETKRADEVKFDDFGRRVIAQGGTTQGTLRGSGGAGGGSLGITASGFIAATPEAMPFSLKLVPAEAVAVVGVRPAKLLANPVLHPFLALDRDVPMVQAATGLPSANIEQLLIVFSISAPVDGSLPTELWIVRSTTPIDPQKYTLPAMGELRTETIAGQTVYRAVKERAVALPYSFFRSAGAPRAYYFADDRTVVISSPVAIESHLRNPPQGKQAKWAEKWASVAGEDLAIMLDVKAAGLQGLAHIPEYAALVSFSPLWEQTDRVIAGGTLGEKLKLHATGECSSPEAAQRVAKTLEAAITLGVNGIDAIRGDIAQVSVTPQRTPQQSLKAMLPMFEIGGKLLKEIKVVTNDAKVQVTAETPAESLVALQALAPAVDTAREAAKQQQAINNLKQLALAMHNYHDKNGHFPAAVVMGVDGKTPHSWRVAILPYLEEGNDLYKQYHLDEPWDSENNLKLLEKMPSVLRSPLDDVNSTNASYFAVVGPEAAFPGDKVAAIKNFTDGTSNTILLVEAKRTIPWTKPADVTYAADKPLPQLGGWIADGGFLAAFADGSVRVIGPKVNEEIIRKLFTKAGREVVEAFQ